MSSQHDESTTTDATDEWLTLAELAERTGADLGRVRHLVREKRLVTVRRGGVEVVPAAFVGADGLHKGLGGVTTLLYDKGFDAEGSLSWMLSAEDSLGASPIQALTEGRAKEVKRVAQALG